MVLSKTVKLPFPFDRIDLFILDVTLEENEDRTVFRRDFYLADDDAPEGMVLIKRGPVLLAEGMKLPVKLPAVQPDSGENLPIPL